MNTSQAPILCSILRVSPFLRSLAVVLMLCSHSRAFLVATIDWKPALALRRIRGVSFRTAPWPQATVEALPIQTVAVILSAFIASEFRLRQFFSKWHWAEVARKCLRLRAGSWPSRGRIRRRRRACARAHGCALLPLQGKDVSGCGRG